MLKTKKVLPVLLSMIVLFVGMITVPVMAQDIQVTVNGQTVKFTDQKPFLNQDNRTLVPVRAPMEMAGCKVDWAEATQTVVVSQNGLSAEFVVGSNQYRVNGQSKTMDTKAQIYNGRTCFPIRFVAEAMGMKVDWNEGIQTVVITGAATGNQGTAPVTPTVDPKQTEDSNPKAMTDMTAEAKARLMAYPYPVDKKGKQYEIIHPMIEYNKCPCAFTPTVFDWISSAIKEKAAVKQNQKFLTDGDLCYSSYQPVGGTRIRGVLQTTNSDGTVVEQDVEFGFDFGTEFVTDGQQCKPSHWLDPYDFVALNSPIK